MKNEKRIDRNQVLAELEALPVGEVVALHRFLICKIFTPLGEVHYNRFNEAGEYLSQNYLGEMADKICASVQTV